MKRVLISGCFSIVWLNAISQRTVDVDKVGSGAGALNYVYTVGGTPFVTAKFSRVVEGSPFFNEQIMPGAIILSEGKEYKNMLLRLNLLESQVNYISEQQVEMIASIPIKEVVLWDTIQKKDYRFIFSNYIESIEKPDKDFYELLQSGKAELYKQHKKNIMESKPYGSATIEQTIRTENRYYILVKRQWIRVKKLKELPVLIADKQKEVQKFISEKKLSGDNQENFEAVIAYYNSLFIQQQ
jgi:hypothetical protein